MKILGIETSCDETGISILNWNSVNKVDILSENISSQIDIHKEYGGVVPEIAAREHLYNLPILLDQSLKEAKLKINDIDLIAVTRGPGLKGCLLMGLDFAKGLILSLDKPGVAVNHIEGHLYAPFINKEIEYPFLALIVSGGHTEIVKVSSFSEYEILSRTIDDAAGEAFDKSASLLGFEYPGGAALAALADKAESSDFKLPKVMRGNKDFSFSGLKTAVSLLIKKNQKEILDKKMELAFSIQEAIINTLIDKLKIAIKETGIKNIVVTGGVSANKSLRTKIESIKGLDIFFPKIEHCMDNASMIAFVGGLRFDKSSALSQKTSVLSRWPIESIE
ncbi:UNVERIFIED_CONTAM: hypothetical protein GTU68_022307 [Idotea baltica]|nr:hypothetical protein [Idotea baltica]